MAKENQKIYFLALFMVLCAILLRVLGKLGILDVPLGVIRSLLYITLYIGWGIFAYRRILQIQVRRYMLAVSSLCVFWFVIRSMKYYLVTNGICTICQCFLFRFLRYLFPCPLVSPKIFGCRIGRWGYIFLRHFCCFWC